MYAQFVGSIMGLFEDWCGQQGSISWFRVKLLPLTLLLVIFVRDFALNLLYIEVSFDLQNHKFVVNRFFIYIVLFVIAVGIIVVLTRLEPEAAEPVDTSLEKEDADLTERFGIEKFNDSLWQLYCPSTNSPDREVVFFHGLHPDDYANAFWKSWLAMDGKPDDKPVIWPKDWLSKDFPNARILAVSYYSFAAKNDGGGDAMRLGIDLVEDIILKAEIGQNCPVFLVGHSLGGVALKQFLLSADNLKQMTYDKTENAKLTIFLENVRALVCYSSSRGGSNFAKISKKIERGRLIGEVLKSIDTVSRQINLQFAEKRKKLKVDAYGLFETLPYLSVSGSVVPEASARSDMDEYYSLKADHFTTCRPASQQASGYERLQQYLVQSFPDSFFYASN